MCRCPYRSGCQASGGRQIDPNPLVRGRGLRRLRRAGITVTTGVLREECERLNEDFACFIRTGQPFVLKARGIFRSSHCCREW